MAPFRIFAASLLFAAAGCRAGALSVDTDLGVATADLGATNDLASGDLSLGDVPGPGTIGPTGGSVDRLWFAFHGDTRPPECDQTDQYPSAIIRNIFTREAAERVQFAVDLGDHMYVCNNSVAEATTQMGFYMEAAALLGRPTFMTMGNHECLNGATCTPVSEDANSTVYLKALAPISPLPYYTFNVTTHSGLATFVVIADNFWSDTQRQWLEATLTKADSEAKYTIITRHHPPENSQLSNSAIWQIIQAHKYSLFLAGHSHSYRHDISLDGSGRSLRCGCGGAPISTYPGSFFGYGTVLQGPDDRLYVTIFDQATNAIQDAFSVAPQ